MKYTQDDLAGWTKIAHRRTSQSEKLSKVGCYVFSASIISDGGGAADGQLYDGESTDDDRKKDLACATGSMSSWSPNPPVFFRKGLYVNHGSNVTSIDVQFLPTGEKEVFSNVEGEQSPQEG